MLLNDAVLRELYSRRGRAYAPDTILFLENDHGEEMYIIVNGEVEITKMYREQEIYSGATLKFGNTPETIAILGPGDFFGEMALWNDLPRMATARARTGVEVIVFGRGDIETLVQRSPLLALQMLKSMSNRLRDVSRSPRLELVLPQLREAFREIHAAAVRRGGAAAEAGLAASEVAEAAVRATARRQDASPIDPVTTVGQRAPAVRSCLRCGEPVLSRAIYCSQCGHLLGKE